MSEPVDLDGIEARATAAGACGQESWVIGHDFVGKHFIQTSDGVSTIAGNVDGYSADHIAGMDPATTLALVAEVRALRAKVADALEGLEDLAHDNEVTGDDIRAHELTGPIRTLRAALSGERVS